MKVSFATETQSQACPWSRHDIPRGVHSVKHSSSQEKYQRIVSRTYLAQYMLVLAHEQKPVGPWVLLQYVKALEKAPAVFRTIHPFDEDLVMYFNLIQVTNCLQRGEPVRTKHPAFATFEFMPVPVQLVLWLYRFQQYHLWRLSNQKIDIMALYPGTFDFDAVVRMIQNTVTKARYEAVIPAVNQRLVQLSVMHQPVHKPTTTHL